MLRFAIAQRKNLESGQGKWLRDLAATLSAATFPFANLVTVLFHLVRISQGMDGTVEGGEIERPPWLGFTVHNLNCIVAWWHLLLAPHDFSTTAEKLSALLLVGYLSVILVAYYVNGSFPYPFLNRLPLPWGFMAMVLAALLIFVSIFRLGKLVKKAVPFTRPVTEPTKVD